MVRSNFFAPTKYLYYVFYYIPHQHTNFKVEYLPFNFNSRKSFNPLFSDKTDSYMVIIVVIYAYCYYVTQPRLIHPEISIGLKPWNHEEIINIISYRRFSSFRVQQVTAEWPVSLFARQLFLIPRQTTEHDVSKQLRQYHKTAG